VDTRFTHLVGCRLPFQLAVLGGVGTTELAAVVSAGGGLGMVPYGVEPPPTELGPSGIGFLIPYLPPVDVIAEAAGGIGTAERAAALIAAGADAVRVGTRFLACPECKTHTAYVEALLAAGADDTAITGDFDDGGHWPAAVRVLGGSAARARRAGNRSTMPPTREAEDPLAMACYAGTSVADLTRIQPASQVLRDLAGHL